MCCGDYTAAKHQFLFQQMFVALCKNVELWYNVSTRLRKNEYDAALIFDNYEEFRIRAEATRLQNGRDSAQSTV